MSHDWAVTGGKIDAAIVKYGQAGLLRTDGGDIPAKFVVALFDQKERDGELIQSTDLKVYLSADVASAPTLTDRLVIAGAARRIVSIDPVSPAGVVLCYILQVR